MKFLLQVENMFDGSEVTIMTSTMEVASKIYDLGVNKSEICGGSSNLMKCTM